MAALAGVCGRGLWKYGCKYSSNGINATVCVYLSHTMAAWTLIARRIRDPTWQMETAINRARDRACERDRRRREIQKNREKAGGVERAPFSCYCLGYSPEKKEDSEDGAR